MLPTIDLDLARTCNPVPDLATNQPRVAGQTYAFYFDKVIAFAQKEKKSLDRVLTEVVLGGMTGHPVKSAVLFWFSATRDLIILTSCELRQRFDPVWLRQIGGYMECGSNYLPSNARPYLYWDGNNLTRVYPPPGDRKPSQTFLCDLGSLPEYQVGWGEDFAVEAVRAADPEYTVYSIVPEEPEEIITIGKRKCVLSHAFYNLQFLA